jgi:WD40 repeat protein
MELAPPSSSRLAWAGWLPAAMLAASPCWILCALGLAQETEKPGEVRIFEGHDEMVRCVAVSPDGKQLLSGGHDRTIRLWELETGKQLGLFEGHTGEVRSVAFAPDGKTFLSTGQDGMLRHWEIQSGKELHNQSFGAPAPTVTYSPDGKTALVGLDGGSLHLWDVANWQDVRELQGHTSHVVCVAFSPDGKLGASAGEHDKTVRIWEVATGKELYKLEGHTEAVHCVAFSPDSRKVLSGAGTNELDDPAESDHSVRLWDVQTGKELRKFDGHKNGVWSVAFSPDGKWALSCSGHWMHPSTDTTMRLWDVETGKELHKFEGHTSTVWSVVFTPDGQQALSAGDKTVRLWSLPVRKKKGAKL